MRLRDALMATLLLNDTGDLIGAVNMLVDLSDRKRAEEREEGGGPGNRGRPPGCDRHDP